MKPHPRTLRYCLLALDRLSGHPETQPPGLCQADNLRMILAQANSHRDLGRRFTIWDRALGVSVHPSGLY